MALIARENDRKARCEVESGERVKPSSRKTIMRGDRLWLGLMLAPFMVGMTLLIWFPLISGFVLAFTDFNAIQRPGYVGLANFEELIGDHVFRAALGNSLFFMAVATPLRLLGALGFALLLAGSFRGAGLFPAIVFIPSLEIHAASSGSRTPVTCN